MTIVIPSIFVGLIGKIDQYGLKPENYIFWSLVLLTLPMTKSPSLESPIEKLERLVKTTKKQAVLDWVYNNLDYSIYEHLCFIAGDAD